MKRLSLTRREILQKCMAAGFLIPASGFSEARLLEFWEGAEKFRPTPPNALGPFYKKRSPVSALLAAANEPGLPLTVSGRVYNTRGDVLPDAKIEVWHADHFGHYDLEGYHCRAQVPLKQDGAYEFATVMPGHYPDRVAQHVHYLVTATGHKPLVTQLYFATDPVFEGDPDRNFKKDPLLQIRELVRPVLVYSDAGSSLRTAVTFELCLERS